MFKNYKLAFALVAIFLLSLYPISDVDLGWHLKEGEYIFHNRQVPKKDLFSFSLPDYPYVYYSWAGELSIYTFYKVGGLYAVSGLFAAILTLAIFTIYKTSLLVGSNRAFLPLFIVITPLVHLVAGGRMRTFGFLLLTIFYLLLLKFMRRQSKTILFVPVIFLLWANFHGSFPIGLAILLLASLYSIFQAKKVEKKSLILIIILLTSLSLCLVTPYGHRLFLNGFTLTSNEVRYLEAINLDWQSPLRSKVGILIYIGLLFSIVIFTLKVKFDMFQKLLLVLFLAVSAKSQRFLFPFIVIFIPVLNFIAQTIIEKINNQIKKSPIMLTYYLMLGLILILFVLQNILQIIYAYKSQENYMHYFIKLERNKEYFGNWSQPGFGFLLYNYYDQNILTDANWSNLILIRQDNKRVFYYGAMDNFIVDGRPFPFEYLSIINAQQGWQNRLDKYKVQVVYLPNNYPLVGVLTDNPDWKLVYKDDKASVIVRI